MKVISPNELADPDQCWESGCTEKAVGDGHYCRPHDLPEWSKKRREREKMGELVQDIRLVDNDGEPITDDTIVDDPPSLSNAKNCPWPQGCKEKIGKFTRACDFHYPLMFHSDRRKRVSPITPEQLEEEKERGLWSGKYRKKEKKRGTRTREERRYRERAAGSGFPAPLEIQTALSDLLLISEFAGKGFDQQACVTLWNQTLDKLRV